MTADTPLEEAARIMADNKIGGLPVMDGDKLAGIITETDIFKILVELLGARKAGLRLTAETVDQKGTVAQLTKAIADRGGNIVSLVIYAAAKPDYWRITTKVSGLDEAAARAAVSEAGITLVDLRGA